MAFCPPRTTECPGSVGRMGPVIDGPGRVVESRGFGWLYRSSCGCRRSPHTLPAINQSIKWKPGDVCHMRLSGSRHFHLTWAPAGRRRTIQPLVINNDEICETTEMITAFKAAHTLTCHIKSHRWRILLAGVALLTQIRFYLLPYPRVHVMMTTVDSLCIIHAWSVLIFLDQIFTRYRVRYFFSNANRRKPSTPVCLAHITAYYRAITKVRSDERHRPTSSLVCDSNENVEYL